MNIYLLKIQGEIVDKYKRTENGFEQLHYYRTESYMFGKITPKDAYQCAALESFNNNQITMIQGRAGSGKSYLSLGFLFEQLEKRKIDKIIVFCNTIAAQGAAKLGLKQGKAQVKPCELLELPQSFSKLQHRYEIKSNVNV